jgi:cell division transport system ATP-binding protein
VEGISLEIGAGEFVLLVGKTGAGKSTLLKLISLEIFPETGDIILDHHHARGLGRGQRPLWRRRLGIVHQDLRLLTDRSVLESVRLTACCESSLPGRPKSRALKVLAKVGLAHKLHCMPGEISTGEQQRAAIARALVNEPFLLLADEPVSNLDSQSAESVVEVLRRANKAGTAMLVATHQPERFADGGARVVRLDGGRVAGN